MKVARAEITSKQVSTYCNCKGAYYCCSCIAIIPGLEYNIIVLYFKVIRGILWNIFLQGKQPISGEFHKDELRPFVRNKELQKQRWLAICG